jgi:hypothetical protein
MLTWPNKDPSDVSDFAIDWAKHLDAGDSLQSATWSATPAGLTLGASSIAAGKASVWLSGGTAGTTYVVTCQAITTQGRTFERSARLFVTDL